MDVKSTSQNTSNTANKGFLALTSTALILGTFGVWIRLLSQAFTDSGQVLARSIFATIIISAVIVIKKYDPFKIDEKNLKYLSIFCIVFPVSILLFTYSANQIKVSNSLFMLYVGSLISTAFFGKVLFNEKFTFRHILALILVLIGLTFFIYPFSIQSISLGLIFGIMAGLLEGTAHTLRKLMASLKREVIVFYQSASGVVIAYLFVVSSGGQIVKDLTFNSVLIAALFGFLLVAIGYLLVYGFDHFDVNLGTIILATELFFALVINAIFLNEIPTMYEVIGGILIFSGTVVTSLQLGKKSS